MRYFIIMLFYLAVIVMVRSQVEPGLSYKDYVMEGNKLMLENNIPMAIRNYQRAYDIDHNNANINYLLGKAYLSSPYEKNKAEGYLSRSILKIKKDYNPDDYTERGAPLLAYYYLGQALHINYKFDEAVGYYNKFLVLLGPSARLWAEEVNLRKKQCEVARQLVQKPLNVLITNLGDSINSEYPEYGAVLSADEQMIIYTTRRPNNICPQRTPEGAYYEDILVSYKKDENTWTQGQILSSNVNTCEHEASINLNPEGQILILYKDEEGGNIYYTEWDGKNWSGVKSFGSDINTRHWETHATLSPDGNTLYFVSNRPGGLGERDIYRVVKLPNGKWSKALNIGPPINTKYDEDGVFMHPDGKTLYFSSNGPNSMGGFDIFYSVKDEEGKFSEPVNIGFPINTTDDDIFYVTSADGKRAYYSSVREGGQGDKDIYMISMPESGEKPVVLYRGRFLTDPGESFPDDISILVTNKETGEIVGLFRPRKDGNFVFTLRPGSTYKISYQSGGEEFFNEEIYADIQDAFQVIQKELMLEPLKISGKISVKKKSIILNVSCFQDMKDKKPIADAIIYVVEDRISKKYGVYKTDENGSVNNILLSSQKTYTILFEYQHKEKEQRVIQTPETQLGEALTEIFFLNKDGSPSVKKYLTIQVVHQKTKKPLGDASVVIKADNGNQIEQITNAKGMIEKMELLSGLNYTLQPYKSGYYGEPLVINTSQITEENFKRTLMVNVEKKAKEDSRRFEVYFKYKEYVLDTNSVPWKKFIQNIISQSQQGKVKIYITASASKVPASMTNIVLSKMRGEFLRDRISNYIQNRQGNLKNIQFKISAIVSGPEYNKKTPAMVYQKYQYVKARVD